jgi:MoxR-like ATPase
LVRIRFGYPSHSEEVEILQRRMVRKAPEPEIGKVSSTEELLAAKRAVEEVHVDQDLLEYITRVVEGTRSHSAVEVGASPRGSLALFLLSRAKAALEGRDYVIPDDIKALAIPALSHRIILKPEYWLKRLRPEAVIQELLERIPVPREERWSAGKSSS